MFGATAFSLHLASIVLSLLMSLAIYKLAKSLFDDRVAFWSVAGINLTFIYSLGSLIITPDVPMLLFWVLTMIACLRLAGGGGVGSWILLGIFMGAGFDAKYTMVFAGLGTLLFFLFSRDRIRFFSGPGPYVALVFAFLTALPVIIWNYQHDWASFLFQTQRRAGEMSSFRPDFFFGFIGTVIGIYGIIPVPLLTAGIVESLRLAFRNKDTRHSLLIWFSIPLVIFLLPVAFRSWVKMNWTAPAFLGWFIAASAYYHKHSPSVKWIRIWGKFSIVFLAVTFLAVHFVFVLPDFYLGKGDYSAGWSGLASRVRSLRTTIPEPYFICGYEYKTASMLAFYLSDHPETVSNNIVGRPGLQYDYWADPDTLAGYNAIFVYDARVAYRTPEDLKKLFDSVESEEILTIKKGGKKVTDFHIFVCHGYKGSERWINE